MSRLPHWALVRSYVLNSLENGPARVADLVQRGRAAFGFSPGEVEAAAKHFAVITHVKKGQIYWMRPTNLFAIWWALDRTPDPLPKGAGLTEPWSTERRHANSLREKQGDVERAILRRDLDIAKPLGEVEHNK